MSTAALTDHQLREAMAAWEAHGCNTQRAADALRLSRTTLQHRVRMAQQRGITAASVPTDTAGELKVAQLQDRVRTLEAELKFQQREALDAEYVRSKILGLSEQDPEPPGWLRRPTKAFSGPGVPTLFASDFHWGEVVDPSQIGGVNRYSVAIAQERLRTMIEVTVDLLHGHIRAEGKGYPGIVFALGGDMVSGDIHDELSATNEMEMMPVVVDLWSSLAWAIEQLADAFGSVFVPCVTGNHGRNTHKMRAKGRNFTSFDWLLYQFLEKRFEHEPRVRFLTPAGSDAHYAVMGHRYLLTHGDQFRGGDGMIGALGPIIRGDHRKRGRNAQVGMDYDTMLLGHWHQLIQLQRLIVNGSLKGYDEYAYASNFPFEPPRQALWLTHPQHGITFSAPVNVERPKGKLAQPPWVSWRAVA